MPIVLDTVGIVCDTVVMEDTGMTHWAEQYQGSDGSTYRVARANRTDATPIRQTYPTGDDWRCNYCWLNGSHSELAHTESVAAYHRTVIPA